MTSNTIIYIMGVSGVGKSTIAKLLAEDLSIPFFDGDDYHSEENIQKMSSGYPLNDDDRLGWLETLNTLALEHVKRRSCVIVCSALKERYRDLLSKGIEDQVAWVFLTGSYELVLSRVQHRKHHFMPADLLKSQFETLEAPKNAFAISIKLRPKEIVYKIKEHLMNRSEFGLLGLGVMGKSLCRNLASKGFKISMYNRHVNEVEENVALNFRNEYNELSNALPFDNLKDFVKSIARPRKIMLMVNAGKTVDVVVENLIPLLSDGDILIDGGNSNYNKTGERFHYLKSRGIHFIGAGVSGGEEGALKGPSIMPGGNDDAYKEVQSFLESIAAKDKDGKPCCTYVGKEGSGHFVKMVHNGIEYAEMQLLADVYGSLSAAGKNPDEIADILELWKPEANSYLLGITIEILRKKEDGDSLINQILDKAGNKGTGNWATIAAAQLGVPCTMITTALYERYTSFYKEDRVEAEKQFNTASKGGIQIQEKDLLHAYQFARIINHHQGFNLIYTASEFYNWNINLSELARIWTEGCIIKSDLMLELVEVFKSNNSILKHGTIIKKVNALKKASKTIVSHCVLHEVPIPCLTEALSFFTSYTTADATANIIQAQRDYFGAHTYQRKDDPSGKFYHTKWKE